MTLHIKLNYKTMCKMIYFNKKPFDDSADKHMTMLFRQNFKSFCRMKTLLNTSQYQYPNGIKAAFHEISANTLCFKSTIISWMGRIMQISHPKIGQTDKTLLSYQIYVNVILEKFTNTRYFWPNNTMSVYLTSCGLIAVSVEHYTIYYNIDGEFVKIHIGISGYKNPHIDTLKDIIFDQDNKMHVPTNLRLITDNLMVTDDEVRITRQLSTQKTSDVIDGYGYQCIKIAEPILYTIAAGEYIVIVCTAPAHIIYIIREKDGCIFARIQPDEAMRKVLNAGYIHCYLKLKIIVLYNERGMVLLYQ